MKTNDLSRSDWRAAVTGSILSWTGEKALPPLPHFVWSRNPRQIVQLVVNVSRWAQLSWFHRLTLCPKQRLSDKTYVYSSGKTSKSWSNGLADGLTYTWCVAERGNVGGTVAWSVSGTLGRQTREISCYIENIGKCGTRCQARGRRVAITQSFYRPRIAKVIPRRWAKMRDHAWSMIGNARLLVWLLA